MRIGNEMVPLESLIGFGIHRLPLNDLGVELNHRQRQIPVVVISAFREEGPPLTNVAEPSCKQFTRISAIS
jgi:hypothetical protein